MALPFLLLSAMCPQHQADGSVGLSFDAVLTKPTSTDSLLMALGKLLGIVWSTEQPQSPQVEIAFSQQWIRPSAEVLAPLREALEMGQVTDIEDWAYQLIQEHPEFTGFAQAVLDAVKRIDLDAIHRLLEA